MALFRRDHPLPGAPGEPNANFYSYFPEEAQARRYAEAIEDLGLRAKDVWLNDAGETPEWSAPAEGYVASIAKLHKIEKQLDRLAREHGGDYDGNEVAVR